MEYFIYGVLVIGGFFIGYWLRQQRISAKIKTAESKAEKTLAEVKSKQSDMLLKAQDKALNIIENAKKEEEKRRQEINNLQSRLEKRETSFSQKLLELQDKQQKLYDKISKVEDVKEKIHQIKNEQLEKLEKIANMSKDDAQKVLLKNTEEQIKDQLISRIKTLENESIEVLDNKARDMMASSMQRIVSNFTTEITTTTVDLPTDEMKGRIIGREGRNIKVIEQLTGTEIIVDDTPNVITVSGFSPIRRHIAKKNLR